MTDFEYQIECTTHDLADKLIGELRGVPAEGIGRNAVRPQGETFPFFVFMVLGPFRLQV